MTVAVSFFGEDSLKFRRRFNWYERLARLVRYRFHIPLKRSRHSPAHTARGVGVGMFWAMSPTVGLQMLIVLVYWVISRKLFRWDFSLVNGVAWTWVTNIFTVIPAYYLFYVTGALMLGRWDDIGGYQSFNRIWHSIAEETAVGDSWWRLALSEWGLPIAVGWLPWAIFSAWLSYRLSLNFVTRYRKARAKRMKTAKR